MIIVFLFHSVYNGNHELYANVLQIASLLEERKY